MATRPPEIRLPDRGSIHVRDGEPYTVVDLTKRYIRLLGATGVVDVPLYSWPSDFAPVAEEVEEEDRPLRALLVGGDEGGHFERFEQICSSLGVDIVAHWPGRVKRIPSRALPVNIELVIFLVSHISHSLFDTVKEMQKSRGLPAALVNSGGFEVGLRAELARLGLRPEDRAQAGFGGEYLLPVASPVQGRYVWTGSTWTWRESLEERPLLVDDGEWGSEDALSLALAFGTLVSMTRWR